MYQKIANLLTKRMLLNNYGNEEYFEIYVYGLECFLSTVGNVIITILVGLLLGISESMYTYMIFYAWMRGVAGGRHEKSHFRCIVAYLIWAITGIKVVQLIFSLFSLTGISVCLGFSIMFVFMFAPMDSHYKRLSTEKKIQLRRKSRYFVVAFSIGLLSIQVLGGSSQIVCAGTAALLIESLMLIPADYCRISPHFMGNNFKTS